MPVILIVEDNPINRDVLGRRLEKRGYSVRFAEDGPSGIEAAAKLHARPHPDGHRAGRGDGRLGGDAAASRPIRRPPASRSSRSRPAPSSPTARKSLAAGCCDFDTKPVDLPRLLSKIEQSLPHAARKPHGRRLSMCGPAGLRDAKPARHSRQAKR